MISSVKTTRAAATPAGDIQVSALGRDLGVGDRVTFTIKDGHTDEKLMTVEGTHAGQPFAGEVDRWEATVPAAKAASFANRPLVVTSTLHAPDGVSAPEYRTHPIGEPMKAFPVSMNRYTTPALNEDRQVKGDLLSGTLDIDLRFLSSKQSQPSRFHGANMLTRAVFTPRPEKPGFFGDADEIKVVVYPIFEEARYGGVGTLRHAADDFFVLPLRRQADGTYSVKPTSTGALASIGEFAFQEAGRTTWERRLLALRVAVEGNTPDDRFSQGYGLPVAPLKAVKSNLWARATTPKK